MVKKTLILIGPGGVGKGPLAELIRDGAVALDPYRLRPKGPRKESDDPLYANPKLRTEIQAVLTGFGDLPVDIPCTPEKMQWFEGARILFFTVRGEWQCLFLQGLDGEIAKAEVYAPALPAMLSVDSIREALGSPTVLFLNPVSTSITTMTDWADLEEKTRENCSSRGDTDESIQKRVGTIGLEAPAWRSLVMEQGAIELTGWPFPEARFKKENNSELLRAARQFILRQSPDLAVFFKPNDAL